MAARKKSAAKQAASKSVPVEPKAQDPIAAILAEPLPGGDDPRPKAWVIELAARAQKVHPPREVRVYGDSRFTGQNRVAQTQALAYLGVSFEDAAGVIVRKAMAEHRGEKHCDW